MNVAPSPGPAHDDGGRRCNPRARPFATVPVPPSPSARVLVAAASGLLAPTPAGAAPGTAAEASELVRKAAEQLTVVDEQVHEAELIVAKQQAAATAAAEQAAAAQTALAAYEPQLRAIAQSGYTGKTQSRVAAFLTSESADRAGPADDDAGHDRRAHQRRRLRGRRSPGRRASRPRPPRTRRPRPRRPASSSSRRSRPRSRSRSRPTRPTSPGSRPPSRPSSPPPSPGARSSRPANLPMPRRRRRRGHRDRPGPGRRPVPARRLRPGRLRLLRPHVLRLRRGRRLAAALQPGAVPARHPGVARASSQAGDLVFFYTPISHVGLYIGNGMMVHARTYGSPVAVTSVDQRGFRFGVRLG